MIEISYSLTHIHKAWSCHDKIGIGIDHELMPRLFSKFASKSFEGTGLGLFISKSIIEAHGKRTSHEHMKQLLQFTSSFV
jgi:two-component system, OmpR family, sensor histidine kinase VicK